MIELDIKNYAEKINNRLDILLPSSFEEYKSVVESARYSLLAGGKRIRPILLLEFYKLFGGNDECAYNFACAVEMIHTYSLIHDDLPSMDNDDMRRGKPSNHIKFGESLALLAGDSLLTESFCVAARTVGIDSTNVLKAIKCLAENAGIKGMIGGQVIDTCFDGKITKEILNKTHLLKTAALIKAACVCGAILAGADEKKIEKVSKYADTLGLAFQIVDDILDCESTEEKLGKPIGSDKENGKITMVDLLGIDECKKYADKLTKDAVSILTSLGGDNEFLKELTEYLLKREV